MRNHRRYALAISLSTILILTLFLFPDTGFAIVFTVTSTGDPGDGTCDSTCTLRDAIIAANANPGPDMISFNIPAGSDPGCDATSGVCTIQPGTALPAFTDDGTTINGYSQSSAVPAAGATPAALRIVLDGVNILTPADGLQATGSGGHFIAGLTIHRFTRHGIYMNGSLANGIHVEGCHIGTDYLGIAPMPNTEDGVHIRLTANTNVIGGTTSAARNVISANGSDGIELEISSTDNQISGNYIGVDASGLLPLGNAGVGVNVRDNSSSNTIGGNVSGAGNVISSNGSDGIILNNSMTRENVISGNIIGLGVDGATDLGNGQFGIQVVNAAHENTIGGTTPAERNIISGNGAPGVQIYGQNTDDNLVIGNYIGTDLTGTVAVFNINEGVRISNDAHNNIIGGDTAEERNVISGNGFRGVYLSSGPNTVTGNYIGTDVTGLVALGNTLNGVVIYNASGNTIGGTTPGERNLISGNSNYNLQIDGTSSSNNEVLGNDIGVDATRASALGSDFVGVRLSGGAHDNTIGSSTSSGMNLISGHNYGVVITGSGTNSNTVKGNYIGTNPTGILAIPNLYGLQIQLGAQSNTIGGETSGDGNVISGNTWEGLLIEGQDTDSNVICGNNIGVDSTGTDALANGGHGVEISSGPDLNVIGGSTSSCRNVISGNSDNGVMIEGSSTVGNIISANHIGLNESGSASIQNGSDGIYIGSGASVTIVGGEIPGERNVISGNFQNGVGIAGEGATATRVIGNFIGTDATGLIDIGNRYEGVMINAGSDDTEIGGNTIAERNVIAGNGATGVRIEGLNTSGTIVSGNYIGTDVTGLSAMANDNFGVSIRSGPQGTVIGGDTPLERNVISGNGFHGVTISGIGATGNTVQGNYIGTDRTGTGDLGNGDHGVQVADSANNNTVGPDNIIAFNTNDGVHVESAQAITITQNSIHTNGDLGIDLVGGANNGIAAPAIVQTTPGSIVVEGIIFQPDATVELFSNPDNPGEGKTYLGSVPAIGGVFNLTVPCVSDRYLTATATDPTGNTSEFSATFTSTVSCVFLPLIMR